MTSEQLARVMTLPPHEAIEWCTGPAREFFYASALLDDAIRCSGVTPSRPTVASGPGGRVTREWHPPRRFAATLSSVSEHISDARWDGDRLASLSIDGREVAEYVRRFSTAGDVHMWALLRIQGTVRFVIASAGVSPSGVKMRARRIEVIGRCDMDDGSEVQLHGSPGLWRVSKGVLGAMSPPRDVALMPSAVRSAWVDTLGTFVPSDRLLAGEVGDVDSGEFAGGAPDVIIDAVRRQLGAGDADDVERAAAVAVGLLCEHGDTAVELTDGTMPQWQIDAAVTEALRLLSLHDPPPDEGSTIA